MQIACPKCKSLNPLSSNFCGECGASLQSATIVHDTAPISESAAPAPATVGTAPTKTTPKAGEVSYLSRGDVQVTNTRAVLGAKTYAMANITTVTMVAKRGNRAPGLLIVMAGVYVFLGAVAGGVKWFAIGFGLILVGIILVWWVSRKDQYTVRIGSASGYVYPLTSKDRKYIEKIVNAMNRAIVERG